MVSSSPFYFTQILVFLLKLLYLFGYCGSFSKVKAFTARSKIKHLYCPSSQVFIQKKSIINDHASFPKLGAHEDNNIHVYDNVITSSCGEMLHELAIDHSFRATNSDGSSVFPLNNPTTPLEHAIASILSQVQSKSVEESNTNTEDMSRDNDNDRFVEYWSRQEYLNLDTHSDIDEEEFIEEEELRCPDFGHVLYLQVEENVRCPTIVFPDKLMGWKHDGPLLSPHYGNDENAKMASSKKRLKDKDIAMITVPAVEGRLLRFDGRAMHAVPKPFNRWLINKEEEDQILHRQREEEQKYDENDGDCDDDDDDDDILRSVLLFNIWSRPPQDVDPDPDTGELPDGIAVIDDSDTPDGDDCNNVLKQRISFWEEDYGPDFEDVICNESSVWKYVTLQKPQKNDSILQTQDDHDVDVRVRLMGEQSRRCHESSTAKIKADSRKDVESALKQLIVPSILIFKE